VLKAAVADALLPANSVTAAERPKVQRNRWRILQPGEVSAVSKAFSDARACRVFLTFMLTGLRRSELHGLRWGHVNLVEGTLRVVASKSEEGERLIALPAALVEELMTHYQGSSYRSDTDYVFAHPTKGSAWNADEFRTKLDEALKRAGITDRIRIHDLRHAALTNLAATGASPIAVMATAGHRSMQTTKRYLTSRAWCSATTRTHCHEHCSGYRIRVPTRRNPCRRARSARSNASSGRRRPSLPASPRAHRG